MIGAFSDMLRRRVVVEDGEPGVHRYITVALMPDGEMETAAWMTEDGAREAECEMEMQGCAVEVLEAEGA